MQPRRTSRLHSAYAAGHNDGIITVIRNYLLVILRNLRRTKVFSALNILGLAIGMAASLLIIHYVQVERSYDRYHTGAERIYRLRYERTDQSGTAVRFASCCPPAAARIRGTYPEVEQIGRALNIEAAVLQENTRHVESRIFFVEPELLDVLSFTFTEGDPATGLGEPGRCFLSASTALRYFGDTNPVGRTISINKRTDYEVAGIFRDVPPNSHMKVDIMLPWKNLEAAFGPDYYEAWGHTGSYTYLRIAPGTDPRAFEEQLKPLIAAECPWLADYQMQIDLKMQPLTDIHLTSHFMQEHEVNGDKQAVDILFIVALFILVIACVNFVNLSTAISIRRAKEVGLRKVVGASRRQLVSQFFFEIMVTNLMALAAAALTVVLVLPWFVDLTGLPAAITPWTRGWFWWSLAAMFATGVLLSGLYPVITMSSFEPVTVLKGRLWTSPRGIRLRRALVVFQFAVGLILIIATLTVYKQVAFMRAQDPGFTMDQTLVLEAPRVRGPEYGSTFETFKERLLQHGAVTGVTHVTEVPGRQIYWDAGSIFRAGGDVNQSKNYQIVGVDYEYANVFELTFVAGRNFSREFPSDTAALILNETAVRHMGFENPEEAIGDQVNYWGTLFPIIGVLKDYHQQSLKVPFEPHIFRFAPYGRGTMGAIAIRFNTTDTRAAVTSVQQLYGEYFPDNPFDYFFLDEYFDQQYAADIAFGRVYTLFSGLALIIIILGIFGLSSFSAVQRTSEIGIRKVMGASTSGVIALLTKEYVLLALVANLLAAPVAWYAMNAWLEGFAFRTRLGVLTFVEAAALTLCIALLTVSYQVIKASRTNPIEAIRRE